MIISFINYIKKEKRLSSNTITAYKTDILQFFDFIKKTYGIEMFNYLDLKKINHNHIRTWIVHLVNRNIQNVSIKRKISILKSFFLFLLKNYNFDYNPLLKITIPKTKKRLPVFIAEKNLTTLFQLIDNNEIQERKKIEPIRSYLMIDILYSTGIRLSELINIKIQDIDLFSNYVKIYGKRNKERLVPLLKPTITLIKKYLQLRKKLFNPNHDWLFVTNKGNKIYPKMVYRTINNYLTKVTNLNKKSPHVLRHSFATHMLNNGADISVIKDILGHSSLAATQIYTHNSIEELKKIHKNLHPKA